MTIAKSSPLYEYWVSNQTLEDNNKRLLKASESSIYLSLFVMLFSMLLADVFIGFYYNMIFVYLTLFLITFIFFNISNKINSKNLLICSLTGSLIFFIFSNFGVWFLGSLYEKSLTGLVECYILAIPFFLNTLLSTIFFSYSSFIFFNIFEKKLFKKIS